MSALDRDVWFQIWLRRRVEDFARREAEEMATPEGRARLRAQICRELAKRPKPQ